MASTRWRWRGEEHELSLERGAEGLRLEVDGQGFRIDAVETRDPARPRFAIDGQAVSAWVGRTRGAVDVWVGGVLHRFEEGAARAAGPGAAMTDGRILMPMTATLRALHVAVGDEVAAGALLAVVEAMKMEIPLRAPAAAKVASISAAPGDIVEGGALLMTLTVQDGN